MTFEELVENRRRLRRIVLSGDIREALVFLNGLTSHRFIALYRFDDGMLRKLYFYDRENPESDHCPDIRIEYSYCIFLKNTDKSFTLEDSMKDRRVAGHPKRESVRSYCGVPLVGWDGKVFGSACVFDFDAMPIDQKVVELIESLALYVGDSLDFV